MNLAVELHRVSAKILALTLDSPGDRDACQRAVVACLNELLVSTDQFDSRYPTIFDEVAALKARLHSRQAHPNYEYQATTSGRKAPDPAGENLETMGWEACGRIRDDFTDVTYWCRRHDHPLAVAERRAAELRQCRQREARTWYLSSATDDLEVAAARDYLQRTWGLTVEELFK